MRPGAVRQGARATAGIVRQWGRCGSGYRATATLFSESDLCSSWARVATVPRRMRVITELN